MRETVRFGRIGGVAVGAHWSLLVVAGLLVAQQAAVVLPALASGYGTIVYVAVGVLTAGAFLASILLHELAHAAMARRSGVPVQGITLWLLGGIARLGGDAVTARDELRIAAAGPATSVGLAVASGAVALAAAVLGAPELLVAAVGWTALVNLALALFNLLPAAPLDGGRILHAVLWRRRGDRWSATRTATRAGEVVGWGLVALAVVEVLSGYATGLWTALLAWFVISAARAEREREGRDRWRSGGPGGRVAWSTPRPVNGRQVVVTVPAGRAPR